MLGVLWRTSGTPVGGAFELSDRTLPAVDPVLDVLPNQGAYLTRARKERRKYARMYLGVHQGSEPGEWRYGNWHFRSWNKHALVFFDREAKMCQFARLWRSFTCGYLNKLLDEEYPTTNLPHLIRKPGGEVSGGEVEPGGLRNPYLERNFTFLAVTYWRRLPELLPGLFRNPTESDAVAYAEVRMFIPRRRLRWYLYGPGGGAPPDPIGGIGGQFPDLPSGDPGVPGGDGAGYWVVGRQHLPTGWHLFNQHWTCQLVPTAQPALATILQTPPPLPEFAEEQIRLPRLGGVDSYDIGRISPH